MFLPPVLHLNVLILKCLWSVLYFCSFNPTYCPICLYFVYLVSVSLSDRALLIFKFFQMLPN